MRAAGAEIESIKGTDRTMTVIFGFDGDLKLLADAVERVRHTEVLSLGRSLEIVKDLGDAETVSAQYGLGDYAGTHAIGHARMATESDVDIANAHPYWAYPFPDVAVVHNGQLTNFHDWRRRLQRSGHRFQSECDSEIIAVYLAERMSEGLSLEQAMRQSLDRSRRRLHLHLRHRGRARGRQGRARREAAGALRGRRAGRARLRGDRDPPGARSRDRDPRPLRGRGAGMDQVSEQPAARMDERGLVELDDDDPEDLEDRGRAGRARRRAS